MLVSAFLALALPAFVAAQQSPGKGGLKITYPNSDNWWINGNTNTLAWGGDTPSPDTTGTFVAWLSNPDVNLLSGVQALSAQTPTYQTSLAIAALNQKPGTGYVLQFSNPLNQTDVWATSQPFEIKAANSPYPPGAASAGAPQVTATASGSAVAGASGAAGNASHSGASAAPSASTKPSSAGILAVAPVAVAAVAGAAAYIVA
ncbi:uncharacterized protein LOC62_06G008530 [Vanrija pseudolonga]|uniref:DOMON domain-containing protein n=1 Tax=Vanrija pseudolonga TaxID=143232 RepID=A0AAF0YDY7_9TREE|nr:hypothetical protein LOC62_06G008530 [Vanrija pseudolonga]